MQAPTTSFLNAETSKLYSALEDLYAAQGCQVANVEILQTLDPFLEAAGEDLRRRLFTSTGVQGEALCLRPEFTIPVCLQYLVQNNEAPQRFCYLGPIFRQDLEGPNCQYQTGVEHLGTNISPPHEDAEMMTLALKVLALTNSAKPSLLKLGDPALFQAMLQALKLPVSIQNRLSHSYTKNALEQDLPSLFAPLAEPEALPIADQGNSQDLEQALHTTMQAHGLSTTTGRHPKDIAARYLMLYARQEQSLSAAEQADVINILKAYLALRGPAEEMPARLDDFAKRHFIDFGTTLENFKTRLAQCLQMAKGRLPEQFIFSARFARPLDYYTGFVFEIFSDKATQPMAGGGRYDHLLEILGARRPIPAVGFSIWLDRLPAAQGTSL